MTQMHTNSLEQNHESTIQPDQTVGEIVVQHPCLRSRLEQLGIDYCCGGKKPMAEAVAGNKEQEMESDP